jgi:hypothetical protein
MCPHDAMRGASAPYPCGYTHAWAALDDGLHGTLSAAAAWPEKRPARGPRHRVPDAGIPTGTAAAEQRDVTSLALKEISP